MDNQLIQWIISLIVLSSKVAIVIGVIKVVIAIYANYDYIGSWEQIIDRSQGVERSWSHHFTQGAILIIAGALILITKAH